MYSKMQSQGGNKATMRIKKDKSRTFIYENKAVTFQGKVII